MNQSFFQQSYGRMWLTGSVAGWFSSYRTLSSFGRYVTQWGVPTAAAVNLLTAAESASKFNQKTPGRKLFIVTGDAWGFAFESRGEALLNEDDEVQAWIHEFGHLIGLPDLYLYEEPHGDPTGGYDVMGLGSIFSAWSRMRLGWISEDSIVTVTQKQIPTPIYTLEAFYEPTSGIKVIKIQVGQSSARYFLIEASSTGISLGYHIFYVDEMKGDGQGILTFRAILQGVNVLRPSQYINFALVFLERQQKFSVILLGEDRLMVGTLALGEEAAHAAEQIATAAESVDSAWSTNRVQGLEAANSTLSEAWRKYVAADFRDAADLASSAISLAQSATVPASFHRSQDLIINITKRVSSMTVQREKSKQLLQEAVKLLEEARSAFARKQFDLSEAKAEEALGLLSQAELAEKETLTGNSVELIVLLLAAISLVALLTAISWRKRQHPSANAN